MGGFKNLKPTGTAGLSSIPGTKVVWESAAHRSMTKGALEIAQDLPDPACRDILQWLTVNFGNLPEKVVEQDYSWANFTGLFGYNPKGGQVPHFMKDEGQGNLEAYNLSTELILKSGVRAAKSARSPYTFMKDHPRLYGWGLGDRMGWGQEIADNLAPALHTLQDSFSPAHVHRSEKNPFLILQIYAWDKDNKTTHKELDSSWKNSWLGQISKDASAAFIRCVLLSCRFSDYERVFGDTFQKDVAGRYLKHDFGGEEIQDAPQKHEEMPERSAYG